MATTGIDLGNRAVGVFDGAPVTVKPTMFGAIATSVDADYHRHYANFVDQASSGLIRWPGGTLAEDGSVTSAGTASTAKIAGRPAAYDLAYPELLHPTLLVGGSGAPTGRAGLSDILALAVREGTAFSMILPTERYASDPAKAYDDVYAFLGRFFVEGAYNGGKLPAQITFDIGNENYVPGSYGSVALTILGAIRDFRNDYPAFSFQTALQVMQTGQETIQLISVLEDSSYGSNYANLLAEVDTLRIHSLNHALPSITGIEDKSPIYWSVRRMQDAILEARAAIGDADTDIDLYVSAFTVNSNDVAPGTAAGLPGASATLSLFTGLLELGADSAAAWGIATRVAAETSMSVIAPDGTQKLTPQGAVYAQMAKNLVGTQLVATPEMDAARERDFNIYAFEGQDRTVLYVTANDLIENRLALTLDLQNGRVVRDYALTAISASGGLSGEALLSSRTAYLSGNGLSFELAGDYEVIQIVLSHGDALTDGQMSLSGDASANLLTGTPFNERIMGLEGNDTLVAGGGNDTLDGGQGIDLADFSQVTQRMTIDMGKGMAAYGDAVTKLMSMERVIGGSAENRITGSSGSDQISGGKMKDDLVGAAGNDRLEGRDGNDILSGGLGNDVLYGGTGNDSLLGGADRDLLQGGSGKDTLSGGVGNDTLIGGGHDDVLFGNAGADVFILDQAAGHDTIGDFNGREGDRLVFSELANGLRPLSYDDVLRSARMNGTTLEIVLDANHVVSLQNMSIALLHMDYLIL